MPQRITYEWTVEKTVRYTEPVTFPDGSVETDCEDIVGTAAYDSLADALRTFNPTERPTKDGTVRDVLVLVRHAWNAIDGDLDDRAWAYVTDGILPTHFSDAWGNQCALTVPKYLRTEYDRATR